MWNRIELKPREGLFLMRNGMYLNAKDILSEDKDDIIGYCVGHNRITSIRSSKNKMKWSIKNNTIPGLVDSDGMKTSGICDSDLAGKNNTNCIINYCKINGMDLQKYYPAAYYCTSFSPGYRDGEWYLPSMYELMLFSRIMTTFIDECNMIGITTNIRYNTPYHDLWSSTSNSSYTSWYMFTYNCNTFIPIQNNSDIQVVPFLEVN